MTLKFFPPFFWGTNSRSVENFSLSLLNFFAKWTSKINHCAYILMAFSTYWYLLCGRQYKKHWRNDVSETQWPQESFRAMIRGMPGGIQNLCSAWGQRVRSQELLLRLGPRSIQTSLEVGVSNSGIESQWLEQRLYMGMW